MSIVLICLASLVTAFYIAAPFWRVRRTVPRAAERELSGRKAALASLQARRDNLLREIKDLEFDRRMGKIDREEHDAMRSELTTQAKAVLRQIETLNASGAQPKAARKTARPRLDSDSGLELEIESEILIARARHRRAKSRPDEVVRWRCDCGRTMQSNDAFCASCGAPRPRETAVATA